MAEPTPPSNVQFPSVTGPPASSAPAVQYVVMPHKRSFWRRLLGGLLILALVFSILLNFGLAAMLGGGYLDLPLEKKTLTVGTEDTVLAIYHISGIISDATARQFQAFARQVQGDPKIKAVVIRVDSPGGGVSASDEIWSMVRKIKDSGKKVVVSMGAVAASGGYYVSAAADEIVAQETTITGSIGVIMEWFVLQRGMDKLGIDPVVLKSTHSAGWKDELSLTKIPDERQKAHLREVLDTMQARFEKIVKEGRGSRLTPRPATRPATMPESGNPRLLEVAETEPFNGKIYMGPEAKALGLVDHIGYLDRAIDRAKALAELKAPSVVQFERRRGLLDRMIEGRAGAGINIDSNMLDGLRTPRIMALWQP